ncbi:bifunctional diguanylate cyclase/phosphodiesterase [Marinobacterium jannaschii]|uniref:bifunctional diguanylate cyclase/phosphodiesterase n=1 Tax=Marinobacterium jannaschii TaxID=64970 RepID=UPI000AC80D5E|nr:EAL domain-containing protein [Marinobacterium jannaschii]
MSIKWKAVIFLSAVLISISGLMVGLYTWSIENLEQRQQEVFRDSAITALDGLLSDWRNEQTQLAVLIPGLSNVDSALRTEQRDEIKRALETHWQRLSLYIDVNYLHLFSEDGHSITGIHRNYDTTALQLEIIRKNVQEVLDTEEPGNFLICDSQCSLYVVEPFILDNGVRGVIAIGRNIADIASRYFRQTGADLALILPGARNRNDERYLEQWNQEVWALSHVNRRLPLLRQLQASSGPSPDGAEVTAASGRTYRITELALQSHQNFQGELTLLSIADVTEVKAAQATTIRAGVVTGLIGLLLSELLLVWLIWRPTERLRSLAAALPLLADNRFRDAQSRIETPRSRLLPDEFDVLENSALNLCSQLEQLNIQVEERTGSLKSNMEEQKRAREFMHRVLDTAPMVILTQDLHGTIYMMNRIGRTLTGWDGENDHNPDFYSLHLTESLPTDVQSRMMSIIDQTAMGFQHEGHLRDAGRLHYMTWFHSTVTGEAGQSLILSVGVDLTERIEAEQKLSWLASHDPLTSLVNRHSFQERLRQAVAEGRRGALLFIDADHFKYINDTAGHAVGDRVLKTISTTLLENTRDTDVVSRLGGDEFIILLPRANYIDARKVMAKLSRLLNGSITLSDGSLQHFSCSIGGALYPDHGHTDEELLAHADMAMYQAKQRGQGQWHLFDETESILQRIQTDVHWQDQIRRALEQNRFQLHFQPIMQIDRCEVSHHEVLLRMVMDNGDIAMPGQFIEVAERTGLIGQIDQWVLAATMRYLAEYQETFGDRLKLAVNVSAPTLQAPGFTKIFFRLCHRYQIKPSQIIIEITETAFLDDLNTAKQTLQMLVDQGCQIALDDFGVGYSSFNYLKKMPLTYVKLDGSYIKGLAESDEEQLFVRCLSEMVRGFGMITVAEFVETPEVLNILRRLGVNYAQGYLIGKPSPELSDNFSMEEEIQIVSDEI